MISWSGSVRCRRGSSHYGESKKRKCQKMNVYFLATLHNDCLKIIGHREEVGLAVGHPLRFGEALALGTGPIATRVVGVALEAALRPLLHVPAKLRRATSRDGLQNPLLAGGDWMGLPLAVAREPDNVGHFPAGWGGLGTGGSRWATTMISDHGLTPPRGAGRPLGS
jgi:hypothetical protein